ncbi:hypothetical protein VaNZ11_010677 [Volvox africanus]|uniref:Retrotransposon gag domain-containing protein n=1 Tax=Volvox africanus TaxID=51714 RepID=A0ABQ5SA53_9CHLO|nr:hypothetical protein VaNZ11_010677 [Volvox africanus]
MTDEDIAASNRVRNILVKNVQDHHLAIIRAAPNAKGAWERLAAVFAARSDARKSQLVAELSALKMAQNEALILYLARVRNLYTDLTEAGHPITEREVTYNLLVGLPKKISVIVTTLTVNWQYKSDQLGVFATMHISSTCTSTNTSPLVSALTNIAWSDLDVKSPISATLMHNWSYQQRDAWRRPYMDLSRRQLSYHCSAPPPPPPPACRMYGMGCTGVHVPLL